MKRIVSTIALGAAMSFGATMALAQTPGRTTLQNIQAKGFIQCGVTQGLAGFSMPDSAGNWTGMDVDFCRALAAAVFNDPSKVRFSPLSAKDRFTALQSGEIDVLSRNTTWTLQRDTSLGLNFSVINYYDGQGFMVRKSLNVKSARELSGASVCVQTGTTTELNVADFFRANNLKYEPVVFATADETVKAYDAGRCDSYTAGVGALAGQRIKLRNPGEHTIMTELISNDPQGPVTRWGDERWQAIVRWVLNGMIAAEHLGVTSKNVDEMRTNSRNAEIRRLLGADGNFGAMLGLDNAWMFNAIKQVGNYSESYERTVGKGSPLGLERGSNQLWTRGGLLFTPPFQ